MNSWDMAIEGQYIVMKFKITKSLFLWLVCNAEKDEKKKQLEEINMSQ